MSLKALMVVSLAAICLLLVAPGAGATSRILLDTPAPAANTTNTTNVTTVSVTPEAVAVDVVGPPGVVVREHIDVPNMALAWAPGVMDHPDMMAQPMFEGFIPAWRRGEVLLRTNDRSAQKRHDRRHNDAPTLGK